MEDKTPKPKSSHSIKAPVVVSETVTEASVPSQIEALTFELSNTMQYQFVGVKNGETLPLNIPNIKSKINGYIEAYKNMGYTDIKAIDLQDKTIIKDVHLIHNKNTTYKILPRSNSKNCNNCNN